ncbi:MAG: MBL fold metallo-hydrolase, partial [Acidimicrobiia bacterium]|nr:MBL fold metallo-hydrolase [Acidimicrobiia bacterium]
AAATTTGGIGALLGAGFLVDIAVLLAGAVLWVAEAVDGFPALGWWGTGVVGVAVALFRSGTWRPLGAGLAVVAGLAMVLPTAAGPSVVALDVGQGDAILLTGAAGERVLVDGGPDPRRLAERLRAHRVDRLDLVVISHRHADHVAGLDAVWGQMEVGEAWYMPDPDPGVLGGALEAARAAGVPLRSPEVGARFTVGSIDLEIVGPVRRYASPNDGSLVLVATVDGITVGLAGDIETWAQSDLGPLDVDVLKVPHQGAATSDPEWLTASSGSVALISVGPNDFGHPAQWVVDALREGGAVVCRTDLDGDLVVPLERPVAASCGG